MYSDKYVCSNCFSESSITEYIKSNATENYCDYCNKSSEFKISINFCTLINKIRQSLDLIYVDPNDLLYSSDDHGWDNTIDVYDMFDDNESELGIKNTKLIVDIRNYLGDRLWFLEENYYPTKSDSLTMSWNHFSRIIKHRWRYTYFLSKNNTYEPSTKSPVDLLSNINKIIDDCKLVKIIPPYTNLYRARFHKSREKINASTIGTPNPEFIKSANRFSPIGIPMFYSSLSKAACLEEIVSSKGRRHYYSIGTFFNNIDIPVLNLSEPIIEPGFYSENNTMIQSIRSLNNFAKIISQPIALGDEYLDYIPTQVFTEYLRHNTHNKIKGIMYKSSKNNEINLVLFYTNEECKDLPITKQDILVLKEHEKFHYDEAI